MAAQSINHVVLVGHLCSDPELRSLPSGTSVCKLRLGVNTRRKDSATGEWEDKPNFFDVTVWGAQGENAARYLEKGRPVGVQGRLEWREWESTDGTKRHAVDVVAENIQFLGSPPSNGDQPDSVAQSEPAGEEPASAGAARTNGAAKRGGRAKQTQPAPELAGVAGAGRVTPASAIHGDDDIAF